ncbi:MAG: TonB-dependent receptor [Rhodoferax sp.]|nr:TonB-dependent receptor [Rhodoferax sp.]
MDKKIWSLACSLVCGTAVAASGSPAASVSEEDFLSEMPIVLSVSRLAQRVDETPGAVTILDRQFLRLSGARDVVDLLRLIPGFQSTTSFETDAPMATYHGRSDDYANRIQVLVDGRSVYSSHLQGSAGLGWQSLALDDIERIEVLRGSNSAAYGARAFLGVVNIVSRDVRSTMGTATQLTAGDNGVADIGVRYGWGDGRAQYRISLDSRGDDGLRGAFGKARVNRVNFSSHFSQGNGSDLDIRAGVLDIESGRGTPGSAGNNARMQRMGTRFLQADWRRTLGDNEDLLITASHTEFSYRDSFPYLDASLDHFDLGVSVSYVGIPIDFGGKEFNDALSLQHTVRHSADVRTVWGAELRREHEMSRPNFDTREQVISNFARVFGNVEWRVTPHLLVNAGALAESSDIDGSSFSPRVMANWHVADGHTLRAGVSSAFRPPSAYEKYATVRYYDTNGLNPITTVENFGRAGSERILSQELGYNFGRSGSGLSADVRIFNESIRDGIAATGFTQRKEFLNGDNYQIRGLEYQLGWRPTSATRVGFNQTWTDIRVDSLVDPSTEFRVVHGAPRLANVMSVMHQFSDGLDLTVSYQNAVDISLMSDANRYLLFSLERTDVRLAKSFRLAGAKAEVALTVQNLGAPVQDGDLKFYFDRRALLTLRLEN